MPRTGRSQIKVLTQERAASSAVEVERSDAIVSIALIVPLTGLSAPAQEFGGECFRTSWQPDKQIFRCAHYSMEILRAAQQVVPSGISSPFELIQWAVIATMCNTCFAMSAAFDQNLQTAIDALGLPGVMIKHRRIQPGDEYALMREEMSAFAASVTAVRRASGASRIVARELLAKYGFPHTPVPKAKSGAPIWPEGVIGSMSHDPTIAVAAVATRRDFRALGIDIEPAETLPSDLLDIVATPKERIRLSEDPYRGRLLFAAKEAVYKAVYPLDQTFLDHQDVEVSLAAQRAVVNNGRIVEIRFCSHGRLIVVAFIRSA
jgi:4'-phosphopantetheinyl transferase EntD